MLSTRVMAPGPVSIAVRFGALAIVPSAVSLVVFPTWWLRENEPYRIDGGPLATVDPGPALILSALVILPVAAVVGWVAGRVWRRWRLVAVAVALAGGWAAGVALTPLVAAALGIPLTTGLFCFMGCEAYVRSDVPLSGVRAYLIAALPVVLIGFGLVAPLALLILTWRAGVFVWSALTVIAAHSLVFWAALLQISTGALVPYTCLAIGVIAWSRWMRRLDEEAVAATRTPSLRRGRRLRDRRRRD